MLYAMLQLGCNTDPAWVMADEDRTSPRRLDSNVPLLPIK
jgi:hypothetical protein